MGFRVQGIGFRVAKALGLGCLVGSFEPSQFCSCGSSLTFRV